MSLDPGSFLLIMTPVESQQRAHYGSELSVACFSQRGSFPSMTEMRLSKNWIFGTRSLEFETNIPLEKGALSDIIDGCLRFVNPILCGATAVQELRDFKGRNVHDTLLPGIATPKTDELFRVGGVSAVAKGKSDFDWEPFEVVGYSPFTRFEGTHHIVHGVEVERAGGLPSWLPTRLLGMAAPIKPRFFRYGLEHFTSVMTFASLGYAPQVTASLLLDCISDTLALKITHEFKKGGEANPFEYIPAYQTIASVICSATGHDVRGEFQERCSTLR